MHLSSSINHIPSASSYYICVFPRKNIYVCIYVGIYVFIVHLFICLHGKHKPNKRRHCWWQKTFKPKYVYKWPKKLSPAGESVGLILLNSVKELPSIL